MIISRVFSRIARNACNEIRSFASSPSLSRQGSIPILSNERVSCQKPQPLHHSFLAQSMFQRSGFSSSASPQPNQKENNQFTDGQGTAVGNENTPQETSQVGSDRKSSEHQADGSGSPSESQTSESQSVKRRRQGAKRTAFSDSDAEAEGDLSVDDLVKLVQEKEASLKEKQEEVEKMKDKVLRSYAEMENVIERTKRESENSKKFAIQNFAKSLLDVADNLGRASSVVKDSFSKIDQYKDSAGVIPLLKTLLEGVEMTEKQLAEPRAPCSRMTGFRYFSSSSTISSNKIDGVEELNKFGVEKFDPVNEQFDPNRHLAVFQVPDPSKPPGTVAAVLKAGYMLHDRIIRPAEVGVTHGLTEDADQTSGA